MFNKSIFKAIALSALFFSNLALSEQIPLLNHNFESDAIPPDPGWTYHISGWVDSGYGEFGVYAPKNNSIYFTDVGNHGQVAYLNQGARITQTASTSLLQGETYTLTFDVGQRKNHNNLHFAARMKAKGLVVAQLISTEINLIPDGWVTASLSFTATSEMPIGEPLVVEFDNLATTWEQFALDNIILSKAGSGSTSPGTNLDALTLIVEDTTLLVPDQYPNINVALRYLDDKQIKVGKAVTIQVTDCTNQVYTESINVAHPNGDAIHIVGNTDNPESCVLDFGNSSGFVLNNGAKLASLKGFSITGTGQANTSGILVNKSSLLADAEYLIVSNFENGITVSNHSSFTGSYLTSKNNLAVGFNTILHSYSHISNSSTSYNNDGFHTANNSSLYMIGSIATNNSRYGILAALNSHNTVISSSASYNGDNYHPNINVFANHASLISFN